MMKRRYLIETLSECTQTWCSDLQLVKIRSYSNQTHAQPWSLNPIQDLQKFVSVPLIKEQDNLFLPTQEEVEKGHNLFLSKPGFRVKVGKSSVGVKTFPEMRLPEVSFVGRSNCGKSSLIKAIFRDDPEVCKKIRIGKTPGLTKALHFYDIERRLTVVDMPGYGPNMPSHYTSSVESYLKTRKMLCRSFILIDGEIGMTKEDVIGLNNLEAFMKPYVLVVTKIDVVKRSLLIKNLLKILEYVGNHGQCCFPQPFLVSAQQLAGIKLLQTFIAHVTGNLEIKGKAITLDHSKVTDYSDGRRDTALH